MNTLRRFIEIIIAFVGMIIGFPLMILLSLGVLLSMGQPILFRQNRVGLHGESFELIKFRTMTDAKDDNGNLLSDTERTTPLGRFLRRSRLDELPELWNIFWGKMSFVGPRPLLSSSPITQGEQGKKRSSVRPGLTGWAQVNGNTLLSDDEKLALDLWYVENASFGLDAKIILRTIDVVIRGERK